MTAKKRVIDLAEYGLEGERYCPACRTRVAQNATTCFMCGEPLYAEEQPFWQQLLHRWVQLGILLVLLFTGWLVLRAHWNCWQGQAHHFRRNVQAWAVLPSPTTTPTLTPVPPTETVTPTPAATATPTPMPTPTPIIYTVKSGDTMQGIALAYSTSVQAIQETNGLSGDFLMVGDRLVIPPAKPAQQARIGSKVEIGALAQKTPAGKPEASESSCVVPIPIYPAPEPIWPLPGEVVKGSEVYFAWTAPADLRASEMYLLRVWGWPDGKEARFWSKHSSLRVPVTALPGIDEGKKEFAWQVLVGLRPDAFSNDPMTVRSVSSRPHRFSLPCEVSQ